MNDWTNGPWKFKSFNSVHELHIRDSFLRTVASIPLSDDIERDIKIARLIAKAPEMAEFLKHFLADVFCNSQPQMLQVYRNRAEKLLAEIEGNK